jgi:hypothetical protein
MSAFLACLSPAEMYRSHQLGNYAAAFAVGACLALVLLSWHQRSFSWLPLYGALLLIHPAWTMGESSGDCGFGKRNLSGAISFVFICLLVRQVFYPEFRMYRFLLLLSAASLAVWLVEVFYVYVGIRFIGGPPEPLARLVFGYRPLLPFGLVAGLIAVLLYRYHSEHVTQRT